MKHLIKRLTCVLAISAMFMAMIVPASAAGCSDEIFDGYGSLYCEHAFQCVTPSDTRPFMFARDCYYHRVCVDDAGVITYPSFTRIELISCCQQ